MCVFLCEGAAEDQWSLRKSFQCMLALLSPASARLTYSFDLWPEIIVSENIACLFALLALHN